MEWLTDLLTWNLFLFFVLFISLFYYGKSTYNHWKNNGVVYIKPKYPLFGTSFETTFSLKSIIEDQKGKYDFFTGNRYGGIFHLRKPVLFLRDPELIETVLIKDFVHFYNRGGEVDTELDPLSAHLVHLENAEWKSLRNKLTPTFSSGKLKGMHQQLLDCSDGLIKYMNNYKKGNPFEAREVMAKFTTDVIASCAFGLSVNAMNDPDSEFRKIGKRVFQISFLSRIRLAIRSQYPWLLKFLGWRSIPIKMNEFFVNTIKNTLEHRESHNIQRQDFLHLMNELRKQDLELSKNGKNENGEKQLIFDEKLMAANAFVFFVAGFETTASTLSYALYELAINEDIQEKAYREVLDAVKKHGNEPSFEAIKDMDYLDHIVSETLRKYPPVAEVSRKVTKPYRIPDSSVILDTNALVTIPIYSLHHDSEYFPDPERFIPERFSQENKIKKGTYLPFGDGPRICIGLRFARLEIKVALSKILMSYKLSLNRKTISPLQFNKKSFFLVPIGGIWIDINPR